MKYLEMYEDLRINGFNHFEAMAKVRKAIEGDFYYPDLWIDYFCELIERENGYIK